MKKKQLFVIIIDVINNKCFFERRERLRQELCVNGKAHSVDQVKTLILMYHVFL